MRLKKTIVSSDMAPGLSWNVTEDVRNFDISLVPDSIMTHDYVYDMLMLSMDKDEAKVAEWLYNLRCRFIERLKSKKAGSRKCTVRAAMLKARIPKTKTIVALSLESDIPRRSDQDEVVFYLMMGMHSNKHMIFDIKDIENKMIEKALLKADPDLIDNEC